MKKTLILGLSIALSGFGQSTTGSGSRVVLCRDVNSQAFGTDYAFRIATTGTQPGCDSVHQGDIWTVYAAEGLQVCQKLSNGIIPMEDHLLGSRGKGRV